MECIEVVAAVIIRDQRVFAAQRNAKGETGGKWEFPGGKIEGGESHAAALSRELREELNIDGRIRDYLLTVTHQYASFHLTMHCFLCEVVSGPMVLAEHIDSRWLTKAELYEVDWAEADLPVVEYIKPLL